MNWNMNENEKARVSRESAERSNPTPSLAMECESEK